ncbi:N-acetylglutamate synthase, GNAT family [Paenibacillus sp. UNCCL117]|uniref:GNAT family N-acetyltransferase n=1 Tax=unclassified Paenibacillus TaxID=185978 RepID=UPI00087E03C3|nr:MULTISPECIES: GNAT family N-acetyltransferase [unclassified Paenibacillus]SDC90257.1 N-acetylglutamate synthase, GNAT family [Paenibacillus sp. cl123]SFW28785.1 N-acetylglutamate synthase, GNAT family [Paenibacillus sp. UNCCL117]
MLVPIKERVREEAVQELLSYCVFPDPERLQAVTDDYETIGEFELYAYEEEGEILGIVGFTVSSERLLTIRHIAVQPDMRGQGYGRGQILELIELKKPVRIVAETDEDAVDFYRNIGFTVISLGELYPGVERFRCGYEVEEEE